MRYSTFSSTSRQGRILVSWGNHKIGRDTLTLNICSATDCPSRRLGLCQLCQSGTRCYALKAERQYPAVLPYRRRQEHIWDRLPAAEIASQLSAIVKRKSRPIRYLRFSEAGDFRTQADVDKMCSAALLLPDLVVYGYTARRDLDFTRCPDNMVVQGSGFMIHNQFTAVQHPTADRPICPGNCRLCALCKKRRGLDIQVVYH